MSFSPAPPHVASLLGLCHPELCSFSRNSCHRSLSQCPEQAEARVAVVPPSSATPGASIGIATQRVLGPSVLGNSADARRAHWEAGRGQAGVSWPVSPPGSQHLRVLSPSTVPNEAGLSPWRGPGFRDCWGPHCACRGWEHCWGMFLDLTHVETQRCFPGNASEHVDS